MKEKLGSGSAQWLWVGWSGCDAEERGDVRKGESVARRKSGRWWKTSLDAGE